MGWHCHQSLSSLESLPTLHITMAKAMKAMKVMKKKAAMKAMKAMKKKSVRALPKGGIADALAAATSLKKSECSKVLDALAGVATAEVAKGKFTIQGWSCSRRRPSRPGRR